MLRVSTEHARKMTTVGPEELKSRPLHSEGPTRVVWAADGSKLFSGGVDHMIRVQDGAVKEEYIEEPALIEPGDAVHTIHASYDHLVTGCDDGVARIYDIKTNLEIGMLARMNTGAPVRSLKLGLSGTKCAIGSDDMMIKIIDVRDVTIIQQFTGHEKPVRDVSWSPDGSLLITSSSDGTVRVWDVANSPEDPRCVHTFEGLITKALPEDSTASVEAVWHPSGQYFVISNKTHDITVVTRDSWDCKPGFTEQGHSTAVCALAWSANGNYLASASNNEVIIWDSSLRKPVLRTKFAGEDEIVTSLAWRPGQGANTLAIADQTGQIKRWDNLIDTTARAHPTDIATTIVHTRAKSAQSVAANDTEEPAIPAIDALDDPFGDDWLDDDAGILAGEAKDAIDDESIALPPPLVSKYGQRASAGTTFRGQQGQHRFQPGATSERDGRRYLAFNDIGLIHTVARTGYNFITVDFHDRSTHSGYQISDHDRFDMACLGSNGAVFASTGQNGLLSSIYYRPYAGWHQTAEWKFQLSKNENAIGLAIGGLALPQTDDISLAGAGTIVLATDKGYLRFFTSSGIQKYIWSFAGDIVTMAGGAEAVIVVHRTSDMSLGGQQGLLYTLIDLDTLEVFQSGALPVAAGQELRWAGFSDDHLPAIYTSDGIMHVLDKVRRPRQARWTPVFDIARDEACQAGKYRLWPVSIASKQMMAVALKGSQEQPYFPTPLTIDVQLEMPLLHLEAGEESAQLEAQHLLNSLILSNRLDAITADEAEVDSELAAIKTEMDLAVIKGLQAVCKADKLQKALDMASSIIEPSNLGVIKRLAAFYSLQGLSDRLEALEEARLDNPDDRLMSDRRPPKWAGLEDDRTLTAGKLNGHSHQSQRANNPLASDFQPSGKRQRNAERVFPRQQSPTDEVMQLDDVREDEISPAPELLSTADVVERPRKQNNPFAKSNHNALTPSSSAASTNPFLKKKGEAKHLQKSGSFYDRIDTAKAEGVQTTLFGKAPPAASKKDDAKKPSKKRKSDAINGDSARPASISSFFAGDAAKTKRAASNESRRDDDARSPSIETSPVPSRVLAELDNESMRPLDTEPTASEKLAAFVHCPSTESTVV
ncbi:uncharacterized protein L969DRAFT_92534 [Mixia osmundae IAM 14324]|uniref:Uncharacterized protein n=1 Tax=Mixia osmundae (strain CBS 9802 / IAM 14324 / JCM 22182 / KY 12970) TaxID=764103 RepID=G7DXU2_MIXOS|nr:uncharacterized protein L969DRAFT_92534 [Mixia osmundae IAM 14324]KEI41305.1 hypothetical protein L969DRAFT_92534 [Mixia osmundae IAM 14324]GAA95402.1 hypothetical protein E5Q_02056 [Mixia osmundae IAM 14324]